MNRFKNRLAIILLIIILRPFPTIAQEYVFDGRRFAAVVSNASVRSSAESTHNNYLGKINNNFGNINTNMSAVVLAQTIIYNGLSQVNSTLKDGIAVKYMAVTSADILNYLQQALDLAKSDPALLLVTTRIQSECRSKAIALISDISNYILKSGENILADYNARDELLKKVNTQLQVIDGLAYGAWRAMYWAKQRGIIATINPFQNYINHDINTVNQIISNAKYIHQ
ncbi:MAG: hypothetical protein M3O71_21315 [Bacteroidota bacterium]|nr:hypothetical protein [Bacteroidota bacterium]